MMCSALVICLITQSYCAFFHHMTSPYMYATHSTVSVPLVSIALNVATNVHTDTPIFCPYQHMCFVLRVTGNSDVGTIGRRV